jgi:hypothetical protein
MALAIIAPQTVAPGESVTTAAVTILPGLTSAIVTLDLTDAQKQDPATNVTGTVEWAPAGTEDWSLLAQARLEGHVENDPTRAVFIAIPGVVLDQLVDQLVRGRITNDGTDPITFGGSVQVARAVV